MDSIYIVNGRQTITVKDMDQQRMYDHLTSVFGNIPKLKEYVNKDNIKDYIQVIQMSNDMFESARRFLDEEAIFHHLYAAIINGSSFQNSREIFFEFLNHMGWFITDTYTIMQEVLDESCLAELLEFRLVKQNIQEAMEYCVKMQHELY